MDETLEDGGAQDTWWGKGSSGSTPRKIFWSIDPPGNILQHVHRLFFTTKVLGPGPSEEAARGFLEKKGSSHQLVIEHRQNREDSTFMRLITIQLIMHLKAVCCWLRYQRKSRTNSLSLSQICDQPVTEDFVVACAKAHLAHPVVLPINL